LSSLCTCSQASTPSDTEDWQEIEKKSQTFKEGSEAKRKASLPEGYVLKLIDYVRSNINLREPTEDEKNELIERINKIREQYGELRLIIGESWISPRAPHRFPNSYWIGLDPCDPSDISCLDGTYNTMSARAYMFEKIIINGFVENLDFLPMLYNSFSYIIDDIDLLANHVDGGKGKYTDYVATSSSLSAFEKVKMLYKFLQDGGVLTTSAGVLTRLTEKQFAELTSLFDIRVTFDQSADIAKPFQDMPFSSDTTVSRSYDDWNPKFDLINGGAEISQDIFASLKQSLIASSKPSILEKLRSPEKTNTEKLILLASIDYRAFLAKDITSFRKLELRPGVFDEEETSFLTKLWNEIYRASYPSSKEAALKIQKSIKEYEFKRSLRYASEEAISFIERVPTFNSKTPIYFVKKQQS
jgi:hypothetical protein